MPNHTLLLGLVVVLVLEIPQKTEDDDEDETFERIFHAGSYGGTPAERLAAPASP